MTDLTPDEIDLDAAWAAATAPAPEIVWPKYDDDDPDRIAIGNIPEPPDVRAARKKAEAIAATAQAKLTKQLEADPTSDQGTTTYAPGQSPEELAATALAETGNSPTLTPLTDLEQIELDNGFIFGTGTNPHTDNAPPALNVVCTNPTCPNRGQHIELHTDTLPPVRCGGCSTVLHCPHNWEPHTTTEGTLTAPTRHDWEQCTICTTTRADTHTPLPPLNLNDLPVQMVEALTGTNPTGTAQS